MKPVATTKDELLITALRHANDVSGLLNDIGAEVSRLLGEDADDPKYDRLHDLLRMRFLEHESVSLFIAASNLRLDLPQDLRGDDEADAA
jgi:hypothetical protein